ncbi:YbaN family protein [Sinisalibacter aestuarii]|uniref:DUF454 domain-containing protein n=1 Tax=Sinisalibacter aestuarii TaxID=2949426 RepID=A0ABQ5LUJ9_9RHOB|nr:YbaN family protein [Sinisalibacter aestuarii]GKY88652.1 hypothetical protein STA1M1_25210 [Sinisalibacter aestuarii]
MGRFGFLALGWGALALGLAGLALPVLPTTPFLLVAAFGFGRASPGLRNWLVDHPRLGPPIRDWEERGAISARTKARAVIAMAAVLALSLALGVPGWALAVQGVGIAIGAAFVLTRPS